MSHALVLFESIGRAPFVIDPADVDLTLDNLRDLDAIDGAFAQEACYVKSLSTGLVRRVLGRSDAVRAQVVGNLAAVVGFAGDIWVDVSKGNDLTGARGDASRPYATIQAALNVAQTDDVVHLSSGTFLLTAALTIPVLCTRISIVGQGTGTTTNSATIVQSTNTVVFDLSANSVGAAVLTRCMIKDMSIASTTGDLVQADGTLCTANLLLSLGLFLDNVFMATTGLSLDLRYCRVVRVRGSKCTAGAVSHISSSTLSFEQCDFAAVALTESYDGADALRTTTQSQVNLVGSSIGAVTMVGQGRINGDAASSIGSLTGNVVSVSGALRPSMEHHGSIGTIDFQSAAAKMLPDTTTNTILLDFTGCRLTGASALFEVAAPATVQTVLMDGMRGSAAATTLRANAGIALSAKGNAIRVPTYATAGTGTLNPGQMVLTVALAGAVQAFPLGFTSPVTTYAVEVSPDAFATGFAAAIGHAATTFNVQTAAGGGNGRAVVTWP